MNMHVETDSLRREGCSNSWRKTCRPSRSSWGERSTWDHNFMRCERLEPRHLLLLDHSSASRCLVVCFSRQRNESSVCNFGSFGCHFWLRANVAGKQHAAGELGHRFGDHQWNIFWGVYGCTNASFLLQPFPHWRWSARRYVSQCASPSSKQADSSSHEFSGGPYWCAMDNVGLAVTSCMSVGTTVSFD